MNKGLIILIIFLLPLPAMAQDRNDTIPEIRLSTIVMVNHGHSYITFPTDIGDFTPLWFEANLIPNFFIRKSKNSRLMGVLTPQFIIRMYQEESYPIRTPSYIPQISVYYMLSSKAEVNSLSIYGKYVHHSNGQEDDFYNEDGEINFKSGDFSVNYIEMGLIRTNYIRKLNAVQFFGTSMEIVPPKDMREDMHPYYGMVRMNAKFSIFKIPVYKGDDEGKKKAHFSIKGMGQWMFGELNGWSPGSFKRMNVSLALYFHPKFFEDIGFFTQFYHGLDYYNVYYFGPQITVWRFGLMTDKLRF